MSYENTKCPCGGKKERETMICEACQKQFADSFESRIVNTPGESWESRRGSAIRLLTMARKRNKMLPLAFSA